MADLNPKPSPIKPGSMQLSATALNQMLAAIPRLITSGAGISVDKKGDRIVISLAAKQGGPAQTIALATVTEVKDAYLICDMDGATIPVAKPIGLREGGGGYAVDEVLLIARLPSARIETDEANPICWIDLAGGRGGGGQQYSILEVHPNYLICATWDGLDLGEENVYIAKPWDLRATEVVRGTITYGSYSSDGQQRVATLGAATENQVVVRTYLAGDIIYAIAVDHTGVLAPDDLGEILLLDANTGGRAWARRKL